MRNIDEKALIAATDDQIFSAFIEENRRFIMNCVFRTTSRFITTSDDEWSIALIAFTYAVKSYNYDKGSFLSYAGLIIKRKLIDHYRSNQKYSSEQTVNPGLFETSPGDNEEEKGLKLKLSEKLAHTEDNSIKYEIEAANEVFKMFGFSFYDLIEHSPKSIKTRAACKAAVLYLLENDAVRSELYSTRQLPLKTIQKSTALPRKLLERHRKYIIAAAELLSGEYPCLAEYISFIRKEGN